MKTAIALAALMLALPLAADAQTTLYRWVDKDGKVHFSDTPPPPDARSASQKRMGGGYAEGQLPYGTQMAMKRNPVTLYVSSDCGELCAQGRELLAKRGIPYSERNAQTSPEDAQTLKKLVGTLEVPVLAVGDNAIKGYSEAQWQAALDGAGYARAPLPGQVPPWPPQPEAKPAPAAPAGAAQEKSS